MVTDFGKSSKCHSVRCTTWQAFNVLLLLCWAQVRTYGCFLFFLMTYSDRYYRSPLHYAAQNGFKGICADLMKRFPHCIDWVDLHVFPFEVCFQKLRGVWREHDPKNIFPHHALIFYFLGFKVSNEHAQWWQLPFASQANLSQCVKLQKFKRVDIVHLAHW